MTEVGPTHKESNINIKQYVINDFFLSCANKDVDDRRAKNQYELESLEGWLERMDRKEVKGSVGRMIYTSKPPLEKDLQVTIL